LPDCRLRLRAGATGSASALSDETYTYDANGNRVTANGYVYTTGADNQLLSDGTYWYVYDAEGNRIARFVDVDGSETLTAGDTDVTEYAWDARNRLVEVRDYADYAAVTAATPEQVVDYLYDVENRWIGETIDRDGNGVVDQVVGFAYDGDQATLQFKKDVSSEGVLMSSLPSTVSGRGAGGEGGSNSYEAIALTVNDLSDRYLWLANAVDQLMADEQLTADKVVWTLGDQQGTIKDLAVTDASTGVTSIVTHRVYDSYGNLISVSDTGITCLFGYTGRALDTNTGLQFNGRRIYDAPTGRWMSKDPIGYNGYQTNIYVYCGNSPTNATDPSGLEDTQITCVAGWTITDLTYSTSPTSYESWWDKTKDYLKNEALPRVVFPLHVAAVNYGYPIPYSYTRPSGEATLIRYIFNLSKDVDTGNTQTVNKNAYIKFDSVSQCWQVLWTEQPQKEVNTYTKKVVINEVVKGKLKNEDGDDHTTKVALIVGKKIIKDTALKLATLVMDVLKEVLENNSNFVENPWVENNLRKLSATYWKDDGTGIAHCQSFISEDDAETFLANLNAQ
jgi:RHS repeat-associated protein